MVEPPVSHFLVYVRRSYRPNGAPDVSDETQVDAARGMLPTGATHEVIADSGGHHSGRTETRDGYRELIRRVEAGGIAGIAVYDLSRLARSARTMHNLKEVLDRRHVKLLIANMPATRFDDAMGKYVFGQIVLAAELQANLDSERAVTLNRHLFEDGRHRGLPPRGYRNGRDATNRRTLEIQEPDAERVREIVRLLADLSYRDVADHLTRQGYPMTTAAVKDVARRLRVYLGFVVAKRGMDERPGRHPAIITAEQYRAAVAGIRRRTRGGRRPSRFRTYVLSGLLYCSCGRRMRGEAKMARGREWRYYVCRSCPAPSVPAAEAEAAVLSRLARLPLLSRRTLERAEAAAQERITGPVLRSDAKQRERLERAIVALRKQHEWGDLTDAEYRRQVTERRAELTALPDPDRVVAFRDSRRLIESVRDLIRDGGPLAHQRLVRATVERVDAADSRVRRITLAAVLRDSFRLMRPRTVARTRQPDDPTVSP